MGFDANNNIIYSSRWFRSLAKGEMVEMWEKDDEASDINLFLTEYTLITDANYFLLAHQSGNNQFVGLIVSSAYDLGVCIYYVTVRAML
ncbi:5171_t:CDS:2 [Paraglomus occultum]|uniref:5171_t:CDS:1 n=1 Tax=Paraglomus occultum TaxID=144539 RepID=A0A9N8W632_9GLOM|nr:5171_t:CDS:2 [Paraglomus occultum]